MFEARVVISDDRTIGSAVGKTATSAITAAGKNSKLSGLPLTGTEGFPQVNDTVKVKVFENGGLIFTASNYGVHAALQTAHQMNRKSKVGNGR